MAELLRVADAADRGDVRLIEIEGQRGEDASVAPGDHAGRPRQATTPGSPLTTVASKARDAPENPSNSCRATRSAPMSSSFGAPGMSPPWSKSPCASGASTATRSSRSPSAQARAKPSASGAGRDRVRVETPPAVLLHPPPPAGELTAVVPRWRRGSRQCWDLGIAGEVEIEHVAGPEDRPHRPDHGRDRRGRGSRAHPPLRLRDLCLRDHR